MSEPTPGAGLRLSEGRGRWTLGATVLGSGMATLDATVVNLALPHIGTDLDASFSGVAWVLNGYTFSLASLILIGGSLGDRFGRRRIFLVGAAWFTLASLLCALAPTVGVLVAARVLQGVGGALLTPGSLAIIQSTFHPDDRARAIGAWSGLGGVATALGPLVGGWLVDAASWRWIFLINLPVGVAVLLIATRHVPESRNAADPARLDVVGAVLGALALAGLSYGLSEQRWAVVAAGGGTLRRLRGRRGPHRPPDAAAGGVPQPRVHRHQLGHVPALRRLRGRDVPARVGAAGPARLLTAARRPGHACR